VGSPFEQSESVWLAVELSRLYLIVLEYTATESGGNPVWVKVEYMNRTNITQLVFNCQSDDTIMLVLNLTEILESIARAAPAAFSARAQLYTIDYDELTPVRESRKDDTTRDTVELVEVLESIAQNEHGLIWYRTTPSVSANRGASVEAGSETVVSTTNVWLDTVPKPRICASANVVKIGGLVYFDASRSVDIDGTIVSYVWDFGDGANGYGVYVHHRFDAPGEYRVTLTVRDNDCWTRKTYVYVDVVEMNTEAHENSAPCAPSTQTTRVPQPPIYYTNVIYYAAAIIIVLMACAAFSRGVWRKRR
jgi:hypothetical protein